MLCDVTNVVGKSTQQRFSFTYPLLIVYINFALVHSLVLRLTCCAIHRRKVMSCIEKKKLPIRAIHLMHNARCTIHLIHLRCKGVKVSAAVGVQRCKEAAKKGTAGVKKLASTPLHRLTIWELRQSFLHTISFSRCVLHTFSSKNSCEPFGSFANFFDAKKRYGVYQVQRVALYSKAVKVRRCRILGLHLRCTKATA